jgi:glucans biosynthesis protein C
MRERRYDIDWLRVIAMAGVFVLHCTRFFCTEDWHVKIAPSLQNDAWALGRGLFLWPWLMEIFFLVSGIATWYSLRHRTVGEYLGERVKRLLIPLYTVGLFILVPPQYYLDLLTHGEINTTFWHWLPTYVRNLPRDMFTGHNYRNPVEVMPYTFTGHLWFLLMLVVVTILTLPVILYLKSERGLHLIDRLAGWVNDKPGILVFAIPLSVLRVSLAWIPINAGRTWPLFLWYAIYFAFGFIIAADPRFTIGIKRQGWIGLALWMGLFLVVGGVLNMVLGYDLAEGKGFSWSLAIWELAYGFMSWGAVVFLLSMAAKYLTTNSPVLAYSSEAVMPFYLFHQVVILIIGWLVLRWPISSVAMFFVIGIISFPLTLALYEVLVRRFRVMRFLFGMAPLKTAPAVRPQPVSS